ncbi:52 kDa repressor of the inhibitor of the protein kinase-like [Cyclopterus lumpus]|uniref:52 kDa repressor of the inhibitor of the protein kinase-like n=1 Tax=Cyclopterus lumpus TaxID=8103 RepID=UPI0014870CB0|nr:52 kDa repressor of the inhibitor of the protein kinase-like [Cyclopterus lumpus]
MTDCCAAANCDYQQEGSENSPPLFSFPLDPERCNQWLNNCQRQDLASEPPEQLHKLYRLCAKHFDPSVISHQSSSSCVLREDAVPTIFDSTMPVNNQSTCNRKRARDTSEEDPTSVKKTKENTATTEVTEEKREVPGAASELQHENQTQEDGASSKAKETLKVYFKEILALTGFSINGANISSDESIGGTRGQQSFNRICVEKIDKKEILQFSEDLMRDEIQNSLRLARFFSILLQDVTSIEGKEQIPVFHQVCHSRGVPTKAPHWGSYHATWIQRICFTCFCQSCETSGG